MAARMLIGLVAIAIPIWVLIRRRIARLRGQTSHGVTHLPYAIGALSATDIVLIFVYFIAKRFKSSTRRFAASAKTIPVGEKVSLPSTHVDTAWSLGKRRASFLQLFANDRDQLMFAVAHPTPMLPLVFLQPNCPISPFGAVNTKNKFRFIDAGALSDAQDVRVRAVFGGVNAGTRTPRGVEFDVVIEVYTPEKVLVRQDVSILQFLGAQGKGVRKEEVEIGNKVCEVVLTPAHTRQWAACTLDYNPIHVSYFVSRYLFGFGGVIAHGNLAVAAALEKLVQEGSEVAGLLRGKEVVVRVRFKRPMVVPAVLDVRLNGGNFVICSKGRLCVEGSVSEG